jgi:hypothetical protein
MKLMEMFSAIGAPKEEDANIDWISDLKFFIDNDDKMLERFMFPALKKHEKHAGHPEAYKIYLKPLSNCAKIYCEKYEIDDPEEKFSKEKLIELAKKVADQQEKFIEDGDYHRDED